MFAEYLKSKDQDWLIKPPAPQRFLPRNSYKVYLAIKKAYNEKQKVYVHPDCDTDGYMSAKCWDYTLRKLGHQNFRVGQLTKRVHNVHYDEIEPFLKAGYKTIILVDSSTSNGDLIDAICGYTFEDNTHPTLLILDHHETTYKWSRYPENCIVVNPKLETPDMPYYSVSAGVVNALVCDYILTMYGYRDNSDLLLYGYTTMYSDNCPIDNPYMAGYMRSCLYYSKSVPAIFNVFWDNYSAINRNFISFKIAPSVNALIRMGKFKEVDDLFFNTDHVLANKDEFLQMIKDTKERSKSMVAELKKIATVKELGPEAILCILPSNLSEIYYNHIGLVATQFADEHQKVALCLYFNERDKVYVGSARDCMNRDILGEFSTFFKSAGHAGAFGVTIEEDKLDLIPDILSRAALEQGETEKVFDYRDLSSDAELQQMAIYNEMTILGIPSARVKINIGSNFTIGGSAKRSTAKTRTMTIVSFKGAIAPYSTVIVTPSFNANSLECRVEEVL